MYRVLIINYKGKHFMNKNNFNTFQSGFTLIELLMVVSVVAILTTVILAILSSGKDKGINAKIVSQLGQMSNQSFLFIGTMGTGYVVPVPYLVSAGITGAAAGGTVASGTLFNDTIRSNNGLYLLASTLPGDEYIYYGWDGINPNTTGRWFFAVSTPFGAFCNDFQFAKKVFTGVPPTTLANFTAAFPNATVAGGYICS